MNSYITVDGRVSLRRLCRLLSVIILLFSSCSNSVSDLQAGDIAAAGIAGTSEANRHGSEIPEAGFDSRSEADAILETMSLSDKIGQLFMLQFRYGENGNPLQALEPADTALIEAIRPGGVILFRENFETVPQVTGLVGELISSSLLPLFLAVDEEGGLVSRLVRSGNIPATPVPSAEVMGNTGDPSTAAELYGIIGRELAALGINMNFAPVADVMSQADNPVIRTRAFGSDPQTVADFVESGVAALQENGVISVVKHFPGHGDSSGDSHYEIISLDHDRRRLDSLELIPFVRAAEAGAGGVMTAHMYFPSIDGGDLPASLSPYFLTELLRGEIGYEGLIITDALEMRGLKDLESPEEAGVLAIANGADMLLIPPDPMEQRDRLLMEAVYRRLPLDRIDAAARRIISVKITQGIWYNQNPPDPAQALQIIGNREHRETLRRVLGEPQ